MGKIFNALHRHAKESHQGDPNHNLILTDWQLLCQYDPNTQKLKELDKDSLNAVPNARRLIENHLILPDGKLTNRGLLECENYVHNKKMLSVKHDPRIQQPSGLDNYVSGPGKAPNKNQSHQYRNAPRTRDENLTREFLSEDMRNILPKIIDLRFISSVFYTKFLFHPQKYIKLTSAEKIEHVRNRYYIIYLETEIVVSVLLDRSGKFMMFAHKNSFLKSSPSHKNSEPHIVDSHTMLEIKSFFFTRLSGSLAYGPLANLFRNVFQLQLNHIVNCSKGDFIIVRDQIFYQTFLNAVISFSLIIDDDGNYIEMCSNKNKIIPEAYVMELLKLHDPVCKIDLKRNS